MTELRTVSPDDLTELAEIPEGLRAVVFSPAGLLQSVPYEQLLTKLIATDLAKPTKAVLDANLAHPADSVALVYSDPTLALNGWYRKTGAPGAGGWEQFEELARNARISASAAADYTEIAAASAAAAAVDAQAFAQSIGPLAQVTLLGAAIAPGATYVADRAIVNALTFTRFHGRVIGGNGSVMVSVIVGGEAVLGPVNVTAAGRTDVVDIDVPLNADVEFSVQTVTGIVNAVLLKMQGA